MLIDCHRRQVLKFALGVPTALTNEVCLAKYTDVEFLFNTVSFADYLNVLGVLVQNGDDCTELLQGAIDYCENRGLSLYVPAGEYYINTIHLPNRFVLKGMERYRGGATIFRSLGESKPLISIKSGVVGCVVSGISIYGSYNSSGGDQGLVSFGDNCKFENLRFDGFGAEGLLVGGLGSTVRDVFIQNCLLNREIQSRVKGAFHVGGTDHYIVNVESLSGGMFNQELSSGSYFAACLVSASVCFFDSCIFELSDSGLHVTGDNNRFTSIRCDKNYGSGYVVLGSQNQFLNCASFDNSIYCYAEHKVSPGVLGSSLRGWGVADGFVVAGLYNLFVGCSDFGENVNRTRYAFYGDSKRLKDRGGNVFSGCIARNNVMGIFGGSFN